MTVLRPSLPPSSWTTTRMLPLAFLAPSAPSTAAELARKVGTVAPQASRADDPRPNRRKSRRVVSMYGLLRRERYTIIEAAKVVLTARNRPPGTIFLAFRSAQLELGALQ